MQNILDDRCSTIMAEAIDSLLKTGEVQPAVFFGKGESLRQIDLSFPDDFNEKIMFAEDIRKQAEALSAEYIILVADSWVSSQYKTLPSRDPNRKEAVILTCQYENISFATIQEYSRTKENKIILGEIYTTDSSRPGIITSVIGRPDKTLECNTLC